MTLQNQVFILLIIVTIQPIAYGLVTFYLMYKVFGYITKQLNSFGAAIGQIKLDKAGNEDVLAEIEHSLDYLSRQIARHQEIYEKVSFIHLWVARLDSTLTLLNINISETVEILRGNKGLNR